MSVSLLPPPSSDKQLEMFDPAKIDYNQTSNVTIELLERNNENTKDFLELKSQEFVPVLIYDDMKIGGCMSSVLDRDGVFWLGEARSAIPNNLLYLSEHGQPVAFKLDKSNQSSGFIFGDIFAVIPEVILEIDRVNRNNFSMHRSKQYACLLDQEYTTKGGKKRPIIPVWMYHGDEEFWSDREMTLGAYKDFDDKKWFWYDQTGVAL